MMEVLLATALLLGGLPQAPMNAEIEAQAVIGLLDRGEARAAVERLKRVTRLFPENRQLRFLLARAYLLEDNLFWAERTVRRAIEQWPEDPEFRAWLAAIHLRQGDPELARHDLDPELETAAGPQQARRLPGPTRG